MNRKEKLHNKLNSVYFDLLANIGTYRYEQFLSLMATEIKTLLHAPYTAFYLYDNWSKTYSLVTDSIAEEKLLHKNVKLETDSYSETDFLQGSPEGMETCLIPLSLKHESHGFLIILNDNNKDLHSNGIADLLKKETENVLGVIHQYHINETNDLNNRLLFAFATKVFPSTNRTDILKEIINVLKNRYPEFSYNLLLSQDNEADSSLPIQTIEYSDAVTKRMSTQAFLTGVVQIEDQVNEKQTCIYAPLSGKQAVYGVLKIISPELEVFSEQEIKFIEKFAETAGKAIENATLYQHSEHHVSNLKLINETTQKLNSNLKLSEITKLVRNQILWSSHASQVGIIYYNEESNQKFDILTESTAYFNTKKGHSFVNHLSESINIEALFSGDYRSNESFPYRSVMAIPMSQSGTVHGLIVVMHEESYFFSFETFKLVQSLVQHSTLAFMNTILKDKLEKAVITDYLTKLYSRSYLEEKINQHMETDENGVLILFDIDDFKRINDKYGHHVGDEVLKQIASIMKQHIESEDVPARWGGEELAIYLPATTIQEGFQIAGVISKQVEENTKPTVTLSSGVSSWVNGVLDTVSDLFIRTDKALYEAKGAGKNSVVQR
ncbi:hypothetical protein CIL05_06635 [Virgibacillus profundi]|uniref:GGDEF domain-containing protein n=1 Tax=Virgibacillus profundi TaxID=2024555 RepID=A0A2A2IES5_9BACI|nr:diguanylate cyclase [Virgibacillus profundi]PAV30137.1 hypothetical protein CIL05_06635 [Virgibacillus profundi]PXY54309.1 GGDEF domain-containing protein [Virgibacillus profundi]